MKSPRYFPIIVIAGLDPAIQKARQRRLPSQESVFDAFEVVGRVFLKRDAALRLLDPRVKPGGDELESGEENSQMHEPSSRSSPYLTFG